MRPTTTYFGYTFIVLSLIAFTTTFLPVPWQTPYITVVVGALSFFFGYLLLRPAFERGATTASSTSDTADLVVKFIGVQSIVISIILAIGAVWGFTSLRDIEAAKVKAESASQQIKKMQSINYGYVVREIDRQIVDLIKDSPTLDLKTPVGGKAVLDGISQMLEELKTLEENIAKENKSKRIYLLTAVMKFNDNNYPAAIEDLQNVPDSSEKYYLLGALYARQGDLAKAEDAYRKQEEYALKVKGDRITAKSLMGRAILAARKGKTTEAEQLFNQSLETDKNLTAIYYNRAIFYALSGKYEEALGDVGELIRSGYLAGVSDLEKDPDNSFGKLIGEFGQNWKEDMRKKVQKMMDTKKIAPESRMSN